MSTIYNDLDNDFTLIPNVILQDIRVSGLAFKMYSYIAFRLGRDKKWEFYNREIISHFKEGRDAVMKARNELLELGYLEVIKQNKASNGKYLGNDYIIRKNPKKPLTENQYTENPLTENQCSNNKDKKNKDLNKKDCNAVQSNFSKNLEEVSETKIQNSSLSEIPNNSISAKNTQVQLAVQSLPAELTDSLTEDDNEAINLWLNFKKEQRKPYKPSSIPIVVKKLKELAKQSNATMRQIVEQSIASNYQGLFPLKQPTNQQNYDRGKKLNGLNIAENSIVGQFYSSGGNEPSEESKQYQRELEEEMRKLGIK